MIFLSDWNGYTEEQGETVKTSKSIILFKEAYKLEVS